MNMNTDIVTLRNDTESSSIISKKAKEQYNMAVSLLDDDCVTYIDEEKAFKLYKQSAEDGYHPAQRALADFYYRGIRTNKDYNKAYYWCEQAAKNGNKDAIYDLIFYWKDGIVVQKDEKRAFSLCQQLANDKYSTAQLLLGDFYKYGIGTEKK